MTSVSCLLNWHRGINGTDELLMQLVSVLCNDMDLRAGRFRVRGDVIDIFPAYAEQPLRIEFWGDEIESLREFDVLTGETIVLLNNLKFIRQTSMSLPVKKLNGPVNQSRMSLRKGWPPLNKKTYCSKLKNQNADRI